MRGRGDRRRRRTDRPPVVFADFEGKDYGDWKVTGEAFGKGPVRGTLPDQQHVSGYEGKELSTAGSGGDDAVGTLTSPEFKIDRRFISFLIGGGKKPGKACINLADRRQSRPHRHRKG